MARDGGDVIDFPGSEGRAKTRRRKPKEPTDDDGKDFSVLQAEADKIRADAAMAVKRVAISEDTEQMVKRANEISSWRPPK